METRVVFQSSKLQRIGKLQGAIRSRPIVGCPHAETNPKSEIRNPKQIQNSEEAMFQTRLIVEFRAFRFWVWNLFRFVLLKLHARRLQFLHQGNEGNEAFRCDFDLCVTPLVTFVSVCSSSAKFSPIFLPPFFCPHPLSDPIFAYFAVLRCWLGQIRISSSGFRTSGSRSRVETCLHVKCQ